MNPQIADMNPPIAEMMPPIRTLPALEVDESFI